MTAAALKVNLIQQITHIEDTALLMQLDKILHELHQEENNLFHFIKPTRAFLDIENLKREQNYQGFDEVKFDSLIENLAIEDSYETLVAMI